MTSLTVTGPTTLDANVTTSGVQTYNSAVTLGVTDTLMTTNSAVGFVSTVNAAIAGGQGLTIGIWTGVVTFGGVVGGTVVLASLTATGPTTFDGNVTISGQQTYNSAVTLAASDTLSTINAAVDFVGMVDAMTAGGEGLVVNAESGTVTFECAAGGLTALASPVVTGPTTLDANVTTSEVQIYNSAMTLGAPVGAINTLATTNAAVDFAGTVDATAVGGQGLAVNAGSGTVRFDSAAGGLTALASPAVTGPTTLDGNVTTSGEQTYNSAITLGATDTLATTNSAVDFAGTVDATTASTQGLTVNAAAGSVTFGAVVGGTAALARLTVIGPTTLDGNVTTTGMQPMTAR